MPEVGEKSYGRWQLGRVCKKCNSFKAKDYCKEDICGNCGEIGNFRQVACRWYNVWRRERIYWPFSMIFGKWHYFTVPGSWEIRGYIGR